MERAIAITESLTPLLRANDLLSEDRITNPESQNTGIETTQPIRPIARAGRFSPTTLRTESAIVKAAPDFSSIAPMIVPSKITIPIPLHVPPKPFRIVSRTFAGGIPTARPIARATANNATNG